MTLRRRTLLALSGANALVTNSTSAAQLVRKPIVMVRRIDDTTTLDPHLAFDRPAREIIANTYDTLIASKRAANWIGSAAEHWVVSRDGRTWSFAVGAGRTFSGSARKVTAEE